MENLKDLDSIFGLDDETIPNGMGENTLLGDVLEYDPLGDSMTHTYMHCTALVLFLYLQSLTCLSFLLQDHWSIRECKKVLQIE